MQYECVILFILYSFFLVAYAAAVIEIHEKSVSTTHGNNQGVYFV